MEPNTKVLNKGMQNTGELDPDIQNTAATTHSGDLSKMSPLSPRLAVCPQGHYVLSFLTVDSSSYCCDKHGYGVTQRQDAADTTAHTYAHNDTPTHTYVNSDTPTHTYNYNYTSKHTYTHNETTMHTYASIDSTGTHFDTSMSLTLSSIFPCISGHQHVSYTLVCDFKSDCTDSSDEDFCVFTGCSGSTPFTCADGRQVTLSRS
jgi:hypothetical protein